MKRLAFIAVVVLGWCATESSVQARGGGGCLEQGTPVLTPGGEVPVEQLKPGDLVLGVSCGAAVTAEVQSVVQVQPAAYCDLGVAGRELRVTAEHPLATAPGIFRMASVLRAGDSVQVSRQGGIIAGRVASRVATPAARPAYNLLVAPGGTYVAAGVVVHNKGCFLPDTLIRKSDGSETAISAVQPGDQLLAFAPAGGVVTATVQRVLARDVDEYRVVRTAQTVLRVTPEHPFYVGDSTFKTLEALHVGDSVFAFDGCGLSAQRIEAVATVRARTRVYNLQTDAPNTFFANGLAVHNKGGGCFPAGTPIRTPRGTVSIERMAAGDWLTAVDGAGLPVTAQVLATHVAESPLLIVMTASGSLTTTPEHPLCLASGGFRPAGECGPGDGLLMWQEGRLQPVDVTSVLRLAAVEPVYNLTVGPPHTFVASDFVVHNKGGGGFHGGGGHAYHGSSSGGGSGNDSAVPFVVPFVVMFFVVVVVITIAKAKGQGQNQDLDFVYSPAQVARKSDKTLKLLEFLARQDPSVAPDVLRKQSESTFLKLQQCWQARDYAPMKPLLMPDLYAQHCLEIQGLIRNHEINMIDQLRIDRIELVNVRYTFKEEQREFTALVTATARDYYVDDRTRKRLRGDEQPAQFQEFWTFHLLNKTWLLREVEQSRESDALKEDNFFEQFTDQGVDQIYGQTAHAVGPAGPWLEKQVEIKETRIERMLNFLVQTDKLWNRQTMVETSRRVFLQMTAAWESGDPNAIPADDLFSDVAAHLREEIGKNRAQGITLEFRNLCVRKVELVLIRNLADNRQDEFDVRVRAHAQKCMRKQGAIVQQDADVTPFEQCLTFGRLDNRWKLKEVLLPDAARKLVGQENVDEDSSPQQLQWYYQHKRAV